MRLSARRAVSRIAPVDGQVAVEHVGMADAEAAARPRRPGSGASLADRPCLAAVERLDATVWTADAAWGSAEPVRQVR